MNPVVEICSGKVRGRMADGVAVFKGVPFAAPPFGVNRLRPPRPVAAWAGVRDALEFGPKSPQVAYPPGIAEALAELVGPGEDCLTLNIWTPELRGGGAGPGCPVMVWIPGGMFEFHATGASAFYDGSRFARDGVVCVTIGYRVGAEGFLYLGDGLANLGLLDQIAALEWVQRNIGSFGGDPGHVTIFGESAGGMSVATLLAVPRAKGLFRRAIVESGNTPNVNSPETSRRIARRLAELMDVEPTHPAIAGPGCERMLAAQAQMDRDLLSNPDLSFWGEIALTSLIWAPTVDGDILFEPPIEAIRKGVAADIDLMVGSNLDETRLFLLTSGALDRITAEALSSMAAAYGLSKDGVDAYRAAFPGAAPGDLFSSIQTDWYWRIPALRMADAHARSARAPTFMYEFAWRSPQMGGRLGATHGVEIPFVFDTLGLGTEPLLGPNPPQVLADLMHRSWVGFAKTGDPGWPKFDPVHRATMRFDTQPTMVEDPLGPAIARWRRRAQPA
jgi:carboxylesterase type B